MLEMSVVQSVHIMMYNFIVLFQCAVIGVLWSFLSISHSLWVVWHNVHGQQHTRVSSSYRSSRLGLSHWDPYVMH